MLLITLEKDVGFSSLKQPLIRNTPVNYLLPVNEDHHFLSLSAIGHAYQKIWV